MSLVELREARPRLARARPLLVDGPRGDLLGAVLGAPCSLLALLHVLVLAGALGALLDSAGWHRLPPRRRGGSIGVQRCRRGPVGDTSPAASKREPWQGQSQVPLGRVPARRCSRGGCSAPRPRAALRRRRGGRPSGASPSPTTRPSPGARSATRAAALGAVGEEVQAGVGAVLEQRGRRAERRQPPRVEGLGPLVRRGRATWSASIRAAAAPIARPHLRIPVAVRTRSENGQQRGRRRAARRRA